MANGSPQPEVVLAASADSPGFLQSWFDRRLLQVAGVYLASAWTFFQFVQWLVNRYVLSPYLIDVCLWLLLLLLPSALLVAHAGKRHGGWSRLQKVGIPCNVGVAAGLLLIGFQGKDLGSAQETVTLTDANGNAIERVVPKSEFRKHVAVFFFDNETGSAEADWLQHAIPHALRVDLTQDLFLSFKAPNMYSERIREAGFASGFGLPLALQRQIAKENRADYVLNGTIQPAATGHRIETRLYRAQNGRLLETRTFEGTDLLTLVDQISVQLKHDLSIPSSHIETVVDLPVEELLTASPDAFRNYSEGFYAYEFGQDPAHAEVLLDKAIATDPTFAFAHIQRGNMLLNQQRAREGLAAFQTVQQYSYRVPERLQYAVNMAVFFFNRQPEEALQAAAQWTTLFPDDTEAFNALAQVHAWRGARDEAIAARRKILELDPNQPQQFAHIGNLLIQDARYPEALEAYDEYIERIPDDADGYLRRGEALGLMGDLEGEHDAYRQALVIEPNDTKILANLAYVQLQRGFFEESRDLYEQAVAASRTPLERYEAQASFAQYYALRGNHTTYLDLLEASWTTMAEYATDLDVMRTKASRAPYITEAGRPDLAQAFLADVRAHPASQDGLLRLNLDIWEAYTLIYTGHAEEALPMLEETRANVERYGLEIGIWLYQTQGLAFEHLERWEEAATAFEAYLEQRPASAYGWTHLGDIRFAQGAYEKAAAHYREALRFYPSYPTAHLGLARVLQAQGKLDDARRHLDEALKAWENAEETEKDAAEARALHATLADASS